METIFYNTNHPNQNTRLLKANEIAALLNISRSFAYQLLKTGEIPVIRLGKACRVRPQDLAEYIENNLHRQADNE